MGRKCRCRDFCILALRTADILRNIKRDVFVDPSKRAPVLGGNTKTEPFPSLKKKV